VLDRAFHFGSLKQGELVEHRFMVRNPESSTLKLRMEDMSLPGMKVRMPQELASGGTGWITVSWDTQTVQGESSAEILVRFNGTVLVPLTLSATIVPPIDILPYPAVFISGFRDEHVTRTLEIVNNDTAPLHIIGLSRGGEGYSAAVRTLEEGRRHQLDIELKGTTPGRLQDVIKVLTDHPRFPVIRIPVNVLVKEDVYVNPESVDFGEIVNHVATPESFLLKARSRPIQVISVMSDIPFVRVTPARADVSALTHEFQVEIDGKAPKGPFAGTISIKTDDRSFPERKVAVEGEIR
jgi:hypothetical protein